MKRKRSRARTPAGRMRRAPRRFARKTTRRSLVVNPNSTVHMHHRWALPSSYSNITSTGSFNWNGGSSDYNPATGIFSSTATGTPTTEMAAAMTFCLKDLPDYAEFTNLYDQFRICAVKTTIKMVNVPESTNQAFQAISNTTNNIYPTIWYAPDHDDINYLSVANLREYSRVKHKVLHPNRELVIMNKPSVLQQVYDGSATTAYAPDFKRKWLDIANPECPHFGLKFTIDFEGKTPTTAAVWAFKINVK